MMMWRDGKMGCWFVWFVGEERDGDENDKQKRGFKEKEKEYGFCDEGWFLQTGLALGWWCVWLSGVSECERLGCREMMEQKRERVHVG